MSHSRLLSVTALAFALVAGIGSRASAATLTGRVLGPGATPVDGVDLDLEDATTGLPVATTGDHTNAQGVFSFSVSPGTYNIAFIPPFAAHLADRKIPNVSIPGNTNLGDVVLDVGLLVTGHVIGPQGGDASNVDVDVDDSFTGQRLPTHADHSDANGVFSFYVAAGTRDFLLLPDKTTALVARIVLGVAVAGDVNLGTIQLQRGFLLSGRVTFRAGGGAAGVDINVYDQSTGLLVPTVGDNADATGNYSVVVPSGTFTVDVEPQIGLGVAHARLFGLAVSSNRTQNFVLDPSTIVLGVSRSGRLGLRGSNYSFGVKVRNSTASAVRATFRVDASTHGAPQHATLVGPLTRRLPASFGPTSASLPLRIPASVPARFVGRAIDLVFSATDPSSGAVLDSDVTQFTIR